MITVDVRGETLIFDQRRAVFWPREQALIIADTHFGKSAVFRREGIALPEGSDAADLAIMGDLVSDYAAKSLYILGDFVHGPLPRNHRFHSQFNAWRRGFPSLNLHVVLGNHDLHLHRQCLDEVHWHHRIGLPPFELVHEPNSGTDFFLAGHIHPVARLSTRADSLRMPIFWWRDDGLVLPSFGALTGGFSIPPRARERRYGVGPETVMELPGAGRKTARR